MSIALLKFQTLYGLCAQKLFNIKIAVFNHISRRKKYVGIVGIVTQYDNSALSDANKRQSLRYCPLTEFLNESIKLRIEHTLIHCSV